MPRHYAPPSEKLSSGWIIRKRQTNLLNNYGELPERQHWRDLQPNNNFRVKILNKPMYTHDYLKTARRIGFYAY